MAQSLEIIMEFGTRLLWTQLTMASAPMVLMMAYNKASRCQIRHISVAITTVETTFQVGSGTLPVQRFPKDFVQRCQETQELYISLMEICYTEATKQTRSTTVAMAATTVPNLAAIEGTTNLNTVLLAMDRRVGILETMIKRLRRGAAR